MIKAWFMVGKLGGFNSGNMQVRGRAQEGSGGVTTGRYGKAGRIGGFSSGGNVGGGCAAVLRQGCGSTAGLPGWIEVGTDALMLCMDSVVLLANGYSCSDAASGCCDACGRFLAPTRRSPVCVSAQVHHNADDDQSYFEYESAALDDNMGSYLHDVGEVEFRGSWARVR